MLRGIRHTRPCLVILAVTLLGCGPGTQKEHRYWEEHKEQAASHLARWPGFGAVLQGVIKRVEPTWLNAQLMTDEAARTKKMKAVNKAVGRLAGPLSEVAHKIESVRATVRELQALDVDKATADFQTRGVKMARKALTEIDQVLSTAKPDNELTAVAGLEPVIARLIATLSALERVHKQILYAK